MEWVKEELSGLLSQANSDLLDSLASHCLSLKNYEQLEEFIFSLVSKSVQSEMFVQDFAQRQNIREPVVRQPKQPVFRRQISAKEERKLKRDQRRKNKRETKKTNTVTDLFGKPMTSKEKNEEIKEVKKEEPKKPKVMLAPPLMQTPSVTKKSTNAPKDPTEDSKQALKVSAKEFIPGKSSPSSEGLFQSTKKGDNITEKKNNKKNKNKKINLADGGIELDAPQVKIGKTCACMGTYHGVQDNCLNCGKVICDAEVGETCGFCGNMLMISKNQIKHHRHVQAISEEQMEKLVEHKNKLIEFDRNDVCRSQIHDLENDHFGDTNSPWLSNQERVVAAAREEQRESKLHAKAKKTYTLDFASKKVTEILEAPDLTHLDPILKPKGAILKAEDFAAQEAEEKRRQNEHNRAKQVAGRQNPLLHMVLDSAAHKMADINLENKKKGKKKTQRMFTHKRSVIQD